MNKKQKILAILFVGLVLFLTGLLVSAQESPGLTPEQLEEFTKAMIQQQELVKRFGAEGAEMAVMGESAGEELTMGYVAAWLGSQLVRVAAFLLNFVLDLSFDILNNDFVIIGWTIARDLANLGFVLFIIIIAIATILRYQEYAAKSTLAKLIAVALLVNFSLMGAGLFVDFSNMLTKFFIINTAGTSYARSTNLADTIAGVFNPGRFLNIEKTEQGWWDQIKGFLGAIAHPIKSLKAIFVWLTGLLFAFVFSLILGFVMLAIAVMFFVRYVALSVLLVLVPLACLFWILPATKNLWEKWWHHFMRWILFAPAASFFLFLAITMMDRYKSQIESASQNAEKVVSNIEITGETAGMVSSAGTLFQNTPTENVAGQIAIGIMLIGFVLGGLIVANSLGIHGSKTFYGWAQAAGKGARAWTGRKGVQYGTGLLRIKGTEEGAKSAAEKIQSWAAARKTGVGRYAAGLVARGTTRLATMGGEDQVKQHEKQIADMSITDAKAALLTSFGPRRIALINKITKVNRLGEVDMTRLATENDKKLFARFNQNKQFGDMEKGGVMSVEMNEARIKGNIEAYEKATADLMAKFTKKDVGMAAFKDVFSGKVKLGLDKKSLEELSKFVAKGVAIKNYVIVPNIMQKMDSVSRSNFEKEYSDAIKTAPKKVQDAWEKTMSNYASGAGPVETTTGTPSP